MSILLKRLSKPPLFSSIEEVLRTGASRLSQAIAAYDSDDERPLSSSNELSSSDDLVSETSSESSDSDTSSGSLSSTASWVDEKNSVITDIGSLGRSRLARSAATIPIGIGPPSRTPPLPKKPNSTQDVAPQKEDSYSSSLDFSGDSDGVGDNQLEPISTPTKRDKQIETYVSNVSTTTPLRKPNTNFTVIIGSHQRENAASQRRFELFSMVPSKPVSTPTSSQASKVAQIIQHYPPTENTPEALICRADYENELKDIEYMIQDIQTKLQNNKTNFIFFDGNKGASYKREDYEKARSELLGYKAKAEKKIEEMKGNLQDTVKDKPSEHRYAGKAFSSQRRDSDSAGWVGFGDSEIPSSTNVKAGANWEKVLPEGAIEVTNNTKDSGSGVDQAKGLTVKQRLEMMKEHSRPHTKPQKQVESKSEDSFASRDQVKQELPTTDTYKPDSKPLPNLDDAPTGTLLKTPVSVSSSDSEPELSVSSDGFSSTQLPKQEVQVPQKTTSVEAKPVRIQTAKTSKEGVIKEIERVLAELGDQLRGWVETSVDSKLDAFSKDMLLPPASGDAGALLEIQKKQESLEEKQKNISKDISQLETLLGKTVDSIKLTTTYLNSLNEEFDTLKGQIPVDLTSTLSFMKKDIQKVLEPVSKLSSVFSSENSQIEDASPSVAVLPSSNESSDEDSMEDFPDSESSKSAEESNSDSSLNFSD